MHLLSITAVFGLLLASVSALDKPLNIEVTHPVECSKKTKKGDKVEVHYRGTLESDGKKYNHHRVRRISKLIFNSGSEFDASYNRGTPLSFNVGNGQVIKGWEEGLLDMCPGEKRKLTIQPEWGYGSRGMGPIPANSVLVFETELVSINGDKGDSGKQDL